MAVGDYCGTSGERGAAPPRGANKTKMETGTAGQGDGMNWFRLPRIGMSYCGCGAGSDEIFELIALV